MAGISSPGIGSGLDIRSLVDSLVRAEGEPAVNRLNRQEAKLQAQLSALGSVKSALSSFKSALAKLTDIGSFQKRSVTSSNEELFSVSVAGKPVAGSYDIEVEQLAQTHKLASAALAEASSAVGKGVLTFQFGDPARPAQSITIDDSNNSLTGLRDAVNAANIGVRASIIKGDAGFQLVFSAENAGTDNSLLISAEEDPLSPGLNDFVQNLTETSAARDAIIHVDGIKVSSATNTITDAIAGVSINLKKAEAGTTASLNVKQDKSSATSAVEGFVNAFNSLVGTVNQLSGYDAETRQAGVLIGDSTLRSVMGQIRSTLGNPVGNPDSPFRALVDLGIQTEIDGTLSLDKSKLTAALESNFDDVGKLFAVTAQATDAQVSYGSSTLQTRIGTYGLNITQAASRGSYMDAASSIDSLLVDAGNNFFNISVDGVSSGKISLTQKTYDSASGLAAELQSRINGDSKLKEAGVSVLVSYDADNNRFSFTSERYGSASKVAITSVADAAASAAIGLTVGSGTDGVDVAGTIGGMSATGNGQYLSGTGALEGLKLLVEGNATGDRGQVSFSRGVADRLGSLLDGWLASDSFISARTNGVQSQLADIGKQRESLAMRLEAVEARYMKQFSALDALMAQMQSTSNWLAGQLANLPGAASGRN